MLSETLLYLDCKPSRVDIDVCMKPETNPKTIRDNYY